MASGTKKKKEKEKRKKRRKRFKAKTRKGGLNHTKKEIEKKRVKLKT